MSLAAYGLITSTTLFRAAGQAEFGIWATVTSIRSMLLVIDGGLGFGVTRDIALATAGESVAATRVRTAVRLYLGAAISALVLAVVFARLPATLLGETGELDGAALATLLIGLETAFALALAPANAALRGIGRFDLLAASSVAMAVSGSLLVVAWTPSLGLIGAAAALLAGRLVGGAVALALLMPRWRPPTGSALGGQLGSVVRFAGPMWAVAIASAIGTATDVPIVGAFFGAHAAGAYGIGAVLPLAVAAFVFSLLDTAFPRLTTLARASVGQVVRVLAVVGAAVGATALGALAWSAPDVMTVWFGADSELANRVVVIYAIVWLINVPAHVLSLALIARDRHQLLTPVVLGEAAANISLSVVLANLIGPLGPAVATLITIGVSNLLVVPALLGPHVGITMGRLLAPAATAAFIGGTIGVLSGVVVAPQTDRELRLLWQGGFTALAIGAIGVAAVRHRYHVQRWLGILFDGGWRVLHEEKAERARIAQTVATTIHRRRPSRRKQPLVTVRIATFNRGRVVAERAIASALAQTYQNIEVVVVGDHCDVATERAVLAVRDPRVRFENLPMRGSYPDDPMFRWMVAGAAPMNRALELARGDWIAPLDDDDEFTPDHVAVLLEACLQRDLDLAYGKADMEIRPGEWAPVGSWPPAPGGIVHASVLYSSRFRSMRHSFDSWRLNEPGDWNLWRRMIAAGARFGFVDKIVVRHYLEYREVITASVP